MGEVAQQQDRLDVQPDLVGIRLRHAHLARFGVRATVRVGVRARVRVGVRARVRVRVRVRVR